MTEISVLMPARSAETTVQRAIQSVLDQTDVTLEILVSESGSRDRTRDVIAELAQIDPRVVLLNEGPDGVGAALNACAERATGRYYIELDADDAFAPDCLSTMVRALDAAPSFIGFAHGAVQYTCDDTFLFRPGPATRGALRRGNVVLYPFMYRRQAWDAGCRYHDHLFIEGRYLSFQDWDMALQLVEFMRYDGIALPDLLVLNYTYNRAAEGQAVGARHQTELREAFRSRWAKVGIAL